MKWITKYAPTMMFVLFVVLSAVVLTAAIPKLFIPLLAALAAGMAMLLVWRLLH